MNAPAGSAVVMGSLSAPLWMMRCGGSVRCVAPNGGTTTELDAPSEIAGLVVTESDDQTDGPCVSVLATLAAARGSVDRQTAELPLTGADDTAAAFSVGDIPLALPSPPVSTSAVTTPLSLTSSTATNMTTMPRVVASSTATTATATKHNTRRHFSLSYDHGCNDDEDDRYVLHDDGVADVHRF